MFLNKIIDVKGCITQEKYVKGKSPGEIERILGFHSGRLSTGMVVAALSAIPTNDQFDLLGYTQVAEHRFDASKLKGLEVNNLKDILRKTVFTRYGLNRLIKIRPNTSHQNSMSDDDQYPPGLGVPQWKLKALIPAKVIAIVLPGQRYL
ncbi:hypothetical protein BH11BAC4_BH11BAC4_14760 [soil metagenome]